MKEKRMEASPCSSMNGWSSVAFDSSRCTNIDAINDKWVNKIPVIKPFYYGVSLQIHDELVRNGLSAISIKHHRGIYCDSIPEITCGRRQRDENGCKREGEDGKLRADHGANSDSTREHSTTGSPKCWREKIKRRNSFWNVHRPELSKLKWPGHCISPAMLQDFFHHHLRSHSACCGPFHVDGNPESIPDREIRDSAPLRELLPPTSVVSDEKAANIAETNLSIQLNDEDLEPEVMVHKSKAEFCVSVGKQERMPLLKGSTSQQLPESTVQSPGQFQRFPVQRDCLPKEEEEMVPYVD